MVRTTFALIVTVFALAACGGPEFSEDDLQTECGASHPKVGFTAELASHFHDVGGTVHVIDDCTLEIRNFTYDGGGVDVRILGAETSEFELGQYLSENILGQSYAGETLTLSLPNEVTLDDFEHLSVWCVAAGVSFGDGRLKPAAE